MKHTAILAVALAAALSPAPLSAQTSHDHKGAPAQGHAAPAPQAGPGQGGMMGNMHGGGMMDMHAMHHAMPGGMQFVEGRLAFLKVELKITEAQTPQWNKFAEAYRGVAKSMRESHGQMMGGMQGALPERLEAQEKRLAGHLDAIRTIKQALLPLYASLTEEQKKLADGFLHHPLGMM
jgi:hypothetical protein